MQLFSAILDIKDTLTPDGFIQLAIDWNQNATGHPSNVIPGLAWHGERNVRFGDARMWLDIQEYRNGNAIAIRYEKTETDGSVWDTDYVMNFTEMKMAIRLHRSFLAEALAFDPKFSTPHFITLLSQGGHLQDDDDLPTTRDPLAIDANDLDILSCVVGGKRHRLPVVYVSQKADGALPVDKQLLASRLKGVAHVLYQHADLPNAAVVAACGEDVERDGAVGVYFPNPAFANERFYNPFALEDTVQLVVGWANSQNVPPLYTWEGVYHAMLMDRWSSRGADIVDLRRQRDAAEREKDEANQLVDSTDAEITEKDRQIAEMSRKLQELIDLNARKEAENARLSAEAAKMRARGALPVIFQGNEQGFFPGEIKDIVLSALADAVVNTLPDSRRRHVLDDLLASNHYEGLLKERSRNLREQLSGYRKMTPPLRSFLEGLGFTIETDGHGHQCLTYHGDRRYTVRLPSTGSDVRGGDNSASEISRKVF